jgi:hypothetical protein
LNGVPLELSEPLNRLPELFLGHSQLGLLMLGADCQGFDCLLQPLRFRRLFAGRLLARGPGAFGVIEIFQNLDGLLQRIDLFAPTGRTTGWTGAVSGRGFRLGLDRQGQQQQSQAEHGATASPRQRFGSLALHDHRQSPA